LAEARSDLQSRRKGILPVVLPVTIVAVVLGGTALARDTNGNVAVLVVALLVAAVLIVPPTWFLLRRKRRRAERYPGRIWSSGTASYAGPQDDKGLEGSARFAARHSARTVVPIVRLVLINQAIEVIPSFGHQETLSCPLSAIALLEIASKGIASGVTIVTRDDRRAKFLFKPDDGLALALTKLELPSGEPVRGRPDRDSGDRVRTDLTMLAVTQTSLSAAR
jgi:hypothetical protein